MAPVFNNDCADDVISLFGNNVDGASLTKDDLNDLFGATDEILDSDLAYHSAGDDCITVVSQSSSGNQCRSSYSSQGSDNHSGDNYYTDEGTCLLDTDMDLIHNDDEFTDDIISLFVGITADFQ
jgi:hypothetical protein